MSRLTCLLVVLCSVLTPTLGCDWISRRFGHLSGLSLDLIQHMGGPLTKQPSPVRFPDRLYSRVREAEVESQLVFIRDSLDLISGLYHHDNLTSVTWNTKKLEDFQAIIHRQAEELSQCVTANNFILVATVSSSRRVAVKLRNCNRRLTRRILDRTLLTVSLCVQGGSTASWELIRKETKLNLDHLDVLVNLIKASGAASRRRNTPTQRQHQHVSSN
ncbi:interferon phi 1 [Labrus mixtus]|uniref:interferon phi 1 n=1 Tax=Labrus mixtus TaxID=508554 RepID=UPI0029BFE781|nr:interferon phi 1 [Labrus mixtus]